MKNKKKNTWIKFRHTVIRNLAYIVLYTYSRIKYGITIKKHKEKKPRQYLILFNHQTAFDQFFVGMAFKRPVYYLASEDLFSNGWISSIIRYIVAPIPIKKQTADVQAIINCIRVAKEGGTIALAPEGNRTYSGRTEYMSPTIAPLAKKMKLPIALYRIEGGYGVQPRWSDVVRKGKMQAYVYRVIEPEEYADMTNEELFDIIKEGLYLDECKADAEFYHKKNAEYLERVFYVCPFCGLSKFESCNDTVKCTACSREIKYLPTKEFEGVGFEFPFRFTSEWYDYQQNFMNDLAPDDYIDEPLFSDRARMSEVIVYKKKILMHKNAEIRLYGDRITVTPEDGEETVYRFDDIGTVTVLGKNKLNIYYGNNLYQLKGDKRFNALKYVNTFFRYSNVKKGAEYDQFLGL